MGLIEDEVGLVGGDGGGDGEPSLVVGGDEAVVAVLQVWADDVVDLVGEV